MDSFVEAEYVINCRPLTRHFSSDNLVPLRPIDLMVGVLPPVNEEEISSISRHGDRLRKGYKFTQRIADLWWDRWLREYLDILQKRCKWTETHRNLKVGDFVLILDEPTPPRCRYPYGIITDIKCNKDGHVRSATARMSNGRLRNRNIRKFVLLEGLGDDSME